MLAPIRTLTITDMPEEVVLHIYSFLDLPDLAALAQVAPALAQLTGDPVLHQTRLRVIAPSRIGHSLFGTSHQGLVLRPTIAELIQRHIVRGLGIERRFRAGTYIYSKFSITQYENGLSLARRQASSVISHSLRRRPSGLDRLLTTLYRAHVIPDEETSTVTVARSIVPALHQLKWSIQRDNIAKLMKAQSSGVTGQKSTNGLLDFGAWFERRGKGILQDGERVRLAICPDIRKTVALYERLSKSSQ